MNNEFKVSIVIPTKNPGPIFKDVLKATLNQSTPWPYEILIIDSGSTDGTIEYIKNFSNVRLHQIPSAEFGHGKTRNLGIELTSGEFVALLTHDATPSNNLWLFNLIKIFDYSPLIAGVFGRHLPYPDASPFTKRDINNHFEGFNINPPIFRLEDAQRYKIDIGYKQYLHFYSDNNACLRRSVWNEIPYPNVNFAEDQLWAQQIIEKGFLKGYAHEACVYHSHNYSILETFRRSFDESRAFKTFFDYILCGSIKQLMLNSAWCIKNDYRYLFKFNFIIKEWSWFFFVPFYRFAQQAGFYIGSKGKTTTSLYSLFSLDEERKRK